MSKKMYAAFAPLLAVVAFAVVPAAASAVTTYGVCEAGGIHTANCPGTEKFKAFPANERIAVIDKKVGTAEFVLETAAGGTGIKCKKFKSAGFVWNTGVVGHSHEALVFEECVGFGELAGCTPNVTGIIEGDVNDEVTGAEKVKITIADGFGVECGGVSLGSVTGSVEGTQTIATSVLKFVKAAGLTFDMKASTITGEAETETVETKKKVFI